VLAEYSAAHKETQGPGTPTAAQIIEDEGNMGKLTGRVLIITEGASSGIGVETARLR
jgi:hypothetical protein